MYLGFSSMNTVDDPAPGLLARCLEQAGFESLWYGEHSHIPVARTTPYPAGGPLPEPYTKMMDPYVSLMAAAAATTQLNLGTGIALLLERELLSQANTIVTLDRLSAGRLMIGAGVGWNQEQFINASSFPWRRRYLALQEVVGATRTLFREEQPEYHGELVDFDPVWFEPKPLQRGGPPFLLGAMGPLGKRHAAAWADGWMPVDIALPEPAAQIADFRRQVADNGRDPDAVAVTVMFMTEPDPDLLKRLRDQGVARAIIGVGVDNWDQPEVIMPMIERYSRLIPHL